MENTDLTTGERLILVMLCNLYEQLGVKFKGDPDFVRFVRDDLLIVASDHIRKRRRACIMECGSDLTFSQK